MRQALALHEAIRPFGGGKDEESVTKLGGCGHAMVPPSDWAVSSDLGAQA